MKTTQMCNYEPRFRKAKYFWSLAPILIAGLFVTAPISAEHQYGGSRYEHQHDRSCGYDQHRGYHQGHRRDRGYQRGHGSHYQPRHHGRHSRFDVPRSIANHSRYSDYYYGRAYYRDHRHYHTIYRFPVVEDGHRTYRPYSYCNGKIHGSGYFGGDGAHLTFRIRF